MPNYSSRSKANLQTCHQDLRTLFNEVIKHFDCTIVCGERTVQEQQALYAKGRTAPGKIVTRVDGVNKKSKHNYSPSLAVDVVPYPIDWEDEERMTYFAGFVMGIASQLKKEGRIHSDIRWGGDWDSDTSVKDEGFRDRPHFEIHEV